jgi:hypothetical protein
MLTVEGPWPSASRSSVAARIACSETRLRGRPRGRTQGPLALVPALRETSVISAAIIASVVFHEPFGRRRLAPAVAVVAGIILINL